jgi:lipopolysaccharide export system protein LptC
MGDRRTVQRKQRSMLARLSEANSESVDAPEDGEPGREAAFGRARRHSQRVQVLKFLLPLTAAAIAIAFPVYSYLKTPAAVEIKADSTTFSDGKLVMANPKLEGFTKQNLPYSMNALRAIQDVSKQGIVQLETIVANLPLNANINAAVDALGGTYDRDNNTLELNHGVTVKTSDGVVAKLQSAFLDIGKGNMKTDDPVDISHEGSRITADTMTVQNRGQDLTFEKRVRVNIVPAKAKAADKKSGELNVSQ